MVRNASCFALLVLLGAAQRVSAEGEATNGFPNWGERVLLEWSNRARSDPQVEMTACGANCGDAVCYSPASPSRWSENLAHSARFHADNQALIGFLGVNSACALVPNIASLYPASCDGSASCACQGGTATCNPSCTTFTNRITLFGGSAQGENNAGSGDPNATFYLWLFENFPTVLQPADCKFTIAPDQTTNGHRWQILKASGLVGAGQRISASHSVIDYGSGSGTAYKIPSGAHYPQQAASVDAWVNWFDAAGPSVMKVNVGGACSDLTLGRGSATNGAWTASVSGVGSGCHRYFFAFKDSVGNDVLYPTTGSLAIGDGSAQCPDWSSAAPGGCAGFDRIFAYGMEP